MKRRAMITSAAMALSLAACGPEAETPHRAVDPSSDAGASFEAERGELGAAAPREGELAPVVTLAEGRSFVALGSADSFDASEVIPRGPVMTTHSGSGVAAEATLPARIRDRYAAWERRGVSLLGRDGARCEAETKDATVLAAVGDVHLIFELDGECFGAEEGYERCAEEAARTLTADRVFRAGMKTVVVELESTGECERPALASTHTEAEASPKLARRMQAEAIPRGWTRLVREHPTYARNRALYERERRAQGERLEGERGWLDLDESVHVFSFEGSSSALVFVFEPELCGGEYESLSLLIRQPLDGSEPELLPLGDEFMPMAVRDLVAHEGQLSFLGWRDFWSYGFFALDGATSIRFRESGYACPC